MELLFSLLQTLPSYLRLEAQNTTMIARMCGVYIHKIGGLHVREVTVYCNKHGGRKTEVYISRIKDEMKLSLSSRR